MMEIGKLKGRFSFCFFGICQLLRMIEFYPPKHSFRVTKNGGQRALGWNGLGGICSLGNSWRASFDE
jgi:hypothetical protein